MKVVPKKGIMEEYGIAGTDQRADRERKYEISRKLGLSPSAIQSVTSFFEKGIQPERKCSGLPCYLGGSSRDTASSLSGDSCPGYCDHAPVVQRGNVFYSTKGGVEQEIEEGLADYVLEKRQSIDAYMAAGGYSNLQIEIHDLRGVIERSHLKGMGGAGFPVSLKWDSFRKSGSERGMLLVNAHEGEPGTFKDRRLLELFPHSVLDGALLAAASNGIRKVIIGIRSDYDNARMSMSMALREFYEEFGVKSREKLPDTIEIMLVPGPYVTGEETALMEAIEGNRGEPRLRPPFPTETGLYNLPTLVHNAETLVAISEIANGGSFRKSYCLTGDVKKPGVYRLPMGIRAGELIRNYGGTDPSSLKAFMPGGLSGGILPISMLDTPLDYDQVRKTGAGLGTGAVIAISGERCMVDTVAAVAEFFRRESCGKCFHCRYGTFELSDLLQRLKNGQVKAGDMDRGKMIAQVMMDGSICALGQAAGKVFLDSVSRFSDEFSQHLGKKCNAGTCGFGGH